MREQTEPITIPCLVTSNSSAQPIEWKEVDVNSNMSLREFTGAISSLFPDKNLSCHLVLYPSRIPLNAEEDLRSAFDNFINGTNSNPKLCLEILTSAFVGDTQFKNQISDEELLRKSRDATFSKIIEDEFTMIENSQTPIDNSRVHLPPCVKKVFEHFSVNYYQATSYTEIVEMLPIPKVLIEARLTLSPKLAFLFKRRVKKIATWCQLPSDELLSEIDGLLEECRKERIAAKQTIKAEALQNENDPAYHQAACNNCSGKIYNIRYKCILCFDYDLCEECEDENMRNPGCIHDPEHFFIKIHKPNVFSWKTVWLHRTQHLPPGAFSALKRGVRQPGAPQNQNPSIEDLEKQIQLLQNQLVKVKQQESDSIPQAVGEQPQFQTQQTPKQQQQQQQQHQFGFFQGVKNFFQP